MSKWRWTALGVAVVALLLSVINASWLAPHPTGPRILVAHRGLAQQYPREGVERDTCTATRIRPPEHDFIENTIRSVTLARSMGADMVEIDVHPTADGQVVVFHDWTLDCRTEGKGAVRTKTLAELKKLDVGYGYTADGGRTFPLRGKGVGGIPTLEEVLRETRGTRLIINFKSRDPRDAELTVAAFARARVPIDHRFGFYGHPRAIRRLKELVPSAWAFWKEDARACIVDYALLGWTSFVPESCRNTTVTLPLNYQWAIWGWPNRFLARMKAANTKVILMGPYEDGNVAGIETVEQLDDVPRSFRGYLWIEDFYNVGRALER
jgi:glycerophosphoryl diester phosphodiesterase